MSFMWLIVSHVFPQYKDVDYLVLFVVEYEILILHYLASTPGKLLWFIRLKYIKWYRHDFLSP